MRILCILVFLNLDWEGPGLMLTTYVRPIVSTSTAGISPRIPASAGLTCDSGSAQRHDRRDTPVLSSRLLWDLGKPRRAGNNSKFKAGNIQNACAVDISVTVLSWAFQLRSFILCGFVALLYFFSCYVENLLAQFIFPVRIVYTVRFIMFSVITNIYNKKAKGPTLMELFTATGKLNFFFFLTTTDVRCVHHGWHGTHRYDIQVFAAHASIWVHRYSSLLQWSVPLGQRGYMAMVVRIPGLWHIPKEKITDSMQKTGPNPFNVIFRG